MSKASTQRTLAMEGANMLSGGSALGGGLATMGVTAAAKALGFGGGDGRDPFMDMVLNPKKVKKKGQQKDLAKRWDKFEAGERDLGYAKRHKRHGDRYSDLRDDLLPEEYRTDEEGNERSPKQLRRLRDIAMMDMDNKYQWAKQGIDQPEYMEFQDKVFRTAKNKKIRQARKAYKKVQDDEDPTGLYAEKYRRNLGGQGFVNPAAIREEAISGNQGRLEQMAREEQFKQASPQDQMDMTKWTVSGGGDHTPRGQTPLLSNAGKAEVERRMRKRRHARATGSRVRRP
jgi:hypothetical protein